jgi:hypothetical protein
MVGTVGMLRPVIHTGEATRGAQLICADGREQVLASATALLHIQGREVMPLADLSIVFAPNAPRFPER